MARRRRRYQRFPDYVPVALRRQRAAAKVQSMAGRGVAVQPILISGRTIAQSYWGKGWCDHLESFADYSNRLPRGRTYVRNGSVCHLTIEAGRIDALVSGSQMYRVEIEVAKIKKPRWALIKNRCRAGISSLLALLRGEVSAEVMAVVGDRESGLFPKPQEIGLGCTCPDWAVLCKHVAAVLYGVGHRLDTEPELLFTLRGVDPTELIASAASTMPVSPGTTNGVLADNQLSDIFDIELDSGALTTASEQAVKPKKRAKRKATGRKAGRIHKAAKPRRITGLMVARLRSQLYMTMEEFGREVDVSAGTIARWENMRGPLNLIPRTRSKLEVILQ